MERQVLVAQWIERRPPEPDVVGPIPAEDACRREAWMRNRVIRPGPPVSLAPWRMSRWLWEAVRKTVVSRVRFPDAPPMTL